MRINGHTLEHHSGFTVFLVLGATGLLVLILTLFSWVRSGAFMTDFAVLGLVGIFFGILWLFFSRRELSFDIDRKTISIRRPFFPIFNRTIECKTGDKLALECCSRNQSMSRYSMVSDLVYRSANGKEIDLARLEHEKGHELGKAFITLMEHELFDRTTSDLEQFDREESPSSIIAIRQWISLLIPVPQELGENAISKTAYLTWLLIAVVSATSVFAFHSGTGHLFADQYSFAWSQPWRHWGATWVSYFFLHAGYGHLIGNMYFLFVFGDNVEDKLGRLRYLSLILFATVCSAALELAFRTKATGTIDPQMIPELQALLAMTQPPAVLIGASGGVFGVLAYHLLAFPKAEFAMWGMRRRGLTLLGLFVVLQFVGLAGRDASVAYLGHLGGALAGAAFWFALGRNEAAATAPTEAN